MKREMEKFKRMHEESYEKANKLQAQFDKVDEEKS